MTLILPQIGGSRRTVVGGGGSPIDAEWDSTNYRSANNVISGTYNETMTIGDTSTALWVGGALDYTITGKVYCEFSVDAALTVATNACVLVKDAGSSFAGSLAPGSSVTQSHTTTRANVSDVKGYTTWGTFATHAAQAWSLNDILMVAVDATAGYAWFGHNGTWFASGDPANGTNPGAIDASPPAGGYLIGMSAYATAPYVFSIPTTLNYTPPTGFDYIEAS